MDAQACCYRMSADGDHWSLITVHGQGWSARFTNSNRVCAVNTHLKVPRDARAGYARPGGPWVGVKFRSVRYGSPGIGVPSRPAPGP